MAASVAAPESVTWRVHIDRSMWVGGVRSLMLQALHPMAMWGVWQNSNFQEDPFGRLQRTADFVGVATFGSPQEIETLAARVRGIHRSLRILNHDTGKKERLDQPELLLWVHCAEVYSYLETARRAGLPLTDAMADRYLDEQRYTAEHVGLHAEDVPGSVKAMEDYFREMRPQLRATREALETVKFLVWPNLPENLRFLSAGKPAYFPFGALCYYSLPRWAREMYGTLPEVPQPLVTAALRSFRLAVNSIPESVHDYAFMKPTRDMLERTRRNLEAEGYDMSKGLIGLRDPRRWPTRTLTPA
ncbi:oxygenase MpaB family protein [Actinocorallia sp. A-T 12471]|uniref:oxygenase MpaB family protein n=1 Tax=Actinocorallia sp. A-T 12471 TaxID=3089813 RepID=UPI0029CB6C63|nr:oxygenase MpaB family protein [Actinocorallia sp. A-T 12471]MDX6738803.1 oxygenase MpaB family protein [Actinocorallia sp. A-T 12471]